MKDKIIKLTSAAYKLLDFFPESDPLKNRAKEKVLAIMSRLSGIPPVAGENSNDWLAVGEFFSAEREKKKIQLLEDIDILLGYFEVGKSQGWLSGINCLIICNEYEKIKQEIGVAIRHCEGFSPKQSKAELEIASSLPTVAPRNDTYAINRGRFSERQAKIIEFLSSNEKAQVMDLKTVLPDVTKRTIRRDLDELLKAEKIERSGEFNQVFYRIKR